MDFTPVITQVWDTLDWFIPLIPLIGLLKSPWAKGHIGELLMRLLAHWQQDKQTYRRTPTLVTHCEHVQNLKRRSDPTAERRCPKCGSALLIRTVKSGTKAGQQFWGCSGLPSAEPCRAFNNAPLIRRTLIMQSIRNWLLPISVTTLIFSPRTADAGYSTTYIVV